MEYKIGDKIEVTKTGRFCPGVRLGDIGIVTDMYTDPMGVCITANFTNSNGILYKQYCRYHNTKLCGTDIVSMLLDIL